jgi:uncharacterized repeat protein (TIGR01451 family)
MNKKHLFPTTGLVRGALGTVALTAAIVCASQGSAQAAAGTAASATITNMVKVDYFDASGKGLGGTTTPISKSATTAVTVTLLTATPTIGTASPTGVQTVDSGQVQTYLYKVWSNANGIDSYTFDVSALSPNTGTTSSDRYISGVTDAANVTATPAAGTVSSTFNIGAVTILSNSASTVTIPFGTMAANHIVVGETVVINGLEYKVASVANAGSAAAYNAATNTLTAEVPTVLNITAVDNGAANLTTTGSGLAGLTMSELYTVAVSVTATGDPTLGKGTACFTDSLKSATDNTKTITSASACTDFTSSNLAITKTASTPNGKPGDIIEYTVNVTLTGAKATSVKVTDAVPAYTTLVTYSDSYSGSIQTGAVANTDAFALVSPDNGVSSYSLTVGNSDNEGATHGNVGAGDVQSNGAAGALKDMTFYLGTNATNVAGGMVDASQHFVVKYKVKIN